MRKMVLSLMSVATVALAGCNSPSPSQPTEAGASAPASAATAAAPATLANEVSGTISLRDPAPQLSPSATLVVNLVDVSATASGSAPLASKTAPAGSFPQSFELKFDPAQEKPADLYVVQVTLTDGDRHYVMPIQAPVLTQGHKNVVSIQLLAEQTPGEKVLAAFNDVQKQIGGMKVSNGTKLDANISRGWQVFRQAGEVKFIRELVDYGDKGFTSTDYAYKNGNPWAVVQQTKPNHDAKPTSVDSAGWDDSGTLVLKQHLVGSNMQVLDDSTAANLHKQAVSILNLATGGKNK
jgi:putative lipoprotein